MKKAAGSPLCGFGHILQRGKMNEYQLNNIALIKHFFSDETIHLSANEKLVAAAIATHRNNTSFKCCPSGNLLAKETGLSRRTVQRAINKLIDKDVIARLRIKSGNTYKASQYYFGFDISDADRIYSDEESPFVNYFEQESENFEFCLRKGIFKKWGVVSQ